MSRRLLFLTFIFVFFSLMLKVNTQAPPAGSVGGGGVPAIAGCWNYYNQQDCLNTTLHPSLTCSWHPGETLGWCEEKGCWSFYDESTCTANNCTWDANYHYCYKKGCWDYTTQAECNLPCVWESFGYCFEPSCWDYKDKTSCENNVTHPNLNCKWDSSVGYCSGPMDKECWNYFDQITCQGAGCTWTQGSCYELGCWNYFNETDCINAGCKWGVETGGYCKENATSSCWNMNTKDICQSNPSCTWEGTEYCQEKGCWSYLDETSCTNSTLHPNLNCVWDASWKYCKEFGCQDYVNQTDCEANNCTWDSVNGCYKTSCWDYKDEASCIASTDPKCAWDSDGNYCYEPGCWNYYNEIDCNSATDLGCSWKTYGYCQEIGCWMYNTSTECEAHAADKNCAWDYVSSYCYERGCWEFNTSETCLNMSDNFNCEWDTTYEYCYEKGCWNYIDETNCTDAPGCAWDSDGSFCYELGCWNYKDETNCLNTTDEFDCSWEEYGYCQKMGCWYTNQTECNADENCEWYSSGWCSEKGCWNFYTQADCEAHANDMRCRWDSTYQYCYEYGCWNYDNQTECESIPGCKWSSDGNYCYESNCWNIFNQTECLNGTDELDCEWESFEYCYEEGCWNYNTQAECENVTDNLNCTWKTSGWCSGGGDCWNYYDQTSCENANCIWTENSWCEEVGPWNFNTQEECEAAGFNWSSSGGWCSEPPAVECWNYDYNQTGCEELNMTCKWESPYCVKRGCWEYPDESSCNAAPSELDCFWNTHNSTGWCEELGCWNFWNNQTACEEYNETLNCVWQTFEWCELDCWNNTKYPNASTCNTNPRCRWNSQYGYCEQKGCWNYYTQAECENTTDELNCTWDTTWGYGYCKEVGCESYPDESSCLNAGCVWDGGCIRRDCRDYHDSTTCEASNCTWKKSNSCEQRGCWMFTTQDDCENANNTYGLSCTWTGSYCTDYMPGCLAYSGDETACKATGYCWWNVNGTCEEPPEEWKEELEKKKVNPGCWIFDYQKSKCLNVTGCGWVANTSSCVGLEDLGIRCENITDATLCAKIPVLDTCCKWINNTCHSDTVSKKCWENIEPPPEGATFCEDYKSYTDESLCKQIAGDPWYMPCKWSDMGTADTSDDRCVFRLQEKFGDEKKDFKKITNKKDCEFAGGEWKTEYYCEGEKAVPYSWCEMKTGAGKTSCDAACWACEFRPNGTNWGSEEEAMSACKGSKLGYCTWRSDSSAPNGFGYCEMPEEVKFGKGDCSVDCKACEKKSSPKSACESSPAKCKWVETEKKCIPKKEKSCSEDCFRCYNSDNCTKVGGGSAGSCKWDDTTKICMPAKFDKEICFDGKDNDADDKIDCEDVDCFSDPFCGSGMVSGCWKYDTQQKCKDVGAAEGCIWISDPWTGESWCGVKGENCFLWDGDPEGCANQTGLCQWFPDPEGGFCDLNKTRVETCFKLTTEGACKANPNCVWSVDEKTGSSSCDFKPVKCESYGKVKCLNNPAYCSWVPDPEDPTTGECISKCEYSYSSQSACNADPNCQWMSGICDPAEGLGMKMEDCWMYDNNQTGCTEAPACEWHESEGFCDVNKTMNELGCMSRKNQTYCEADPNCKWNEDPYGGWCDLKIFSCGWYSNESACNNDVYGYGGCAWIGGCECMWPVSPEHPNGCTVLCSDYSNDKLACEDHRSDGCEWKSPRCEPICFNITDPAQCTGVCSYRSGFCEPKMAKMMFKGIDSPPVPLGKDPCPEGIGKEQDICGFGVKDSPDNFGFGVGVVSLENSALCKDQQVLVDRESKTLTTGTGTNTVKFYWYLDTDGSEIGGCARYDDLSATGYEFFFKYIAKLENGKLKEIRTAYRCDDGEWVITDIKLSGWKTLMCSEIGGGMIAVDKTDLNKFPELYEPEEEMRIFVATGNRTTTETNPVDTAGPAYYSPGTVDFRFEDCMLPGVDMDGDGLTSENDPDCLSFQKFGFVRFEDCFENGVDEDGDGLVDCDDPDCKFDPFCEGKGVNALNYTDTTAPRLKWYDVDEFPDAAFVKYDTDEPANGSLIFYFNSSTCSDVNGSGKNREIKDPALLDPDTWNDFKNWHDAPIDNFGFNPQRLGYDLKNETTYYYKIKVCDPSGNCGISACLNFTTARSFSKKDCPDCEFTLKLTGPKIKVDLGGKGSYIDLETATAACGGTGVKANYSQALVANLRIEGNKSAITFQNASLVGVSGTVNITEGTTTTGGYNVGYVGMPSENFDELASKMRPKTCTIEVPKGASGTCDKLWKCDDSVSNCVDVTSDGEFVEETSTHCKWKIPCDFSVYRAGTPTGAPSAPSGGGGGPTVGGGGVETTTTIGVETTTALTTTTPVLMTTTPTVTTTIPIAEAEVGVPKWMIGIVVVSAVVIIVFLVIRRQRITVQQNTISSF